MATQEYTEYDFERIEECDDRENFDPFVTPHTLATKIQDTVDSLISISFEAYKLTGSAEKSHGHIAFIINRQIPSFSSPISGVAFYEAKASGIGYEGNRYPSFGLKQLSRLVTNTPKLSYLIYNKEK